MQVCRIYDIAIHAYTRLTSVLEWYWWQLHEVSKSLAELEPEISSYIVDFNQPNNTNSPTWVHHKETYGEEFVYDQFIPSE